MMTEEDILQVIQADEEMMAVLSAASQLQLPDWWICAGFVRSKVWDVLHDFQAKTTLSDIDVIYYDKEATKEEFEKQYEEKLRLVLPHMPWSVKNEARMHLVNAFPPYQSAEDAIAKFPETATAIGVKLDDNKQLMLTAPWGVENLVHLRLKPTPFFKASRDRMEIYYNRIYTKAWQERWYLVQETNTPSTLSN